MKTRLLIITLLLSSMILNAQEQAGVVKTIGRPGQPGKPIENVVVRASGSTAVSISDDSGNFMITLTHYTAGQAYSLSKVYKDGYDLADAGLLERQFPYSADIPLEISMISEEDYSRTKKEIEAKIRLRMEKEYQDKLAALNKQLEEKLISEKLLQQEHLALLDYYDNIEHLVEELSDRYARTDYDHLDSLEQQINLMIEQGRLEEAEALIDSKETKKELDMIKASNAALEEALAEGKLAEARKTNEYAKELIHRFDIAAMRFDNQAAARYLKERMELDPSNTEWKMEYASFIRDYLGYYDEAMNIYQGLLENEHSTEVIANIYGCIGNIYEAKGMYNEALQSYKTTAELRENDESLLDDLALSYYNIASCYLYKDSYKDGLEYLEKARAINEEQQDSLGLSHIYAISATVQHDMGAFEESIENMKRAIDIRVRHLGENSLEIASLYNNLAIILSEQNRFAEAFENTHKALSIHKKILGEKHPAVARDYILLGSLEVETGNNENALEYYEHALSMITEFHSGKHPDIAQVYNQLGSYYKNVIGDIQKGLEYFQMTLEMTRSIYGESHSDYALALYNLGAIYSNMERFDEALAYYKSAQEIWQSLYGTDHFRMGDIYNNLADIHFKLGKYEEAKNEYEKAIEIATKYYGEVSEHTAISYNNLGAVLLKMGEGNEALQLHGKAADIVKAIFGENHPLLARTYNLIGSIFFDYKMYDNAEAYYDEALRIWINAYGTEHQDVAACYNNLSLIYLQREDYAKAEEMLTAVLSITSRIYGENHPNSATALQNLSTLFLKKKEYDKALDYLLKGLAIIEEYYPDGHEKIMLYRYGVANIYFDSEQHAKAIPYMTSIYHDSLKKDGPEDRYTAHYFMFLHQMYLGVMRSLSYDGAFDKGFAELNANTVITATVAKNSQAEKMGLNGTYDVVAHEEWTVSDPQTNFFTFQLSIANREHKTYIFHRDGEFIKVSFEGRLGVSLSPKWIAAEEKQSLSKTFRKWYKKNK